MRCTQYFFRRWSAQGRIEYRWAEGRYDRLPQLAADLVRSPVSVIAIPGTTAAALAAKAATATIPIVFGTGDDPVKLGLVASLNHPGGNATGVSMFGNELVAKRLQLLRDLAPAAKRVAVLVNPPDKTNNEPVLRDLETAAIGPQILPFEAATGREIDAAFERLVSEKAEALFLAPTALSARRVQVAILAARYQLPATSSSRNFVEAGGLMSYGTNQPGSYRQVAPDASDPFGNKTRILPCVMHRPSPSRLPNRNSLGLLPVARM
jgi:ABC-type uncharacterized transport system substrate-binding protein